MNRLIPFLLVLVFSCLTWAQTTSPQPDASVEELAQRLLSPWGDPAGMRVELLPAVLPQDLPFELPLPEGTRVVGSVARRSAAGELLSVQVVADHDQATEETLAALDATFEEQGWIGRPEGKPTGFVPPQANLAAMYCQPEGNAFIYVNAFFVPEAPTDIRIDINLEGMYHPCGESGSHHQEPPQAPLPTLTAPEGSELIVHGGQFLPDQASSSALITSTLGLQELANYYEQQLVKADWQILDEHRTDFMSYSTWTRTDDQAQVWSAVLSVSELAAADQVFASLVITTDTAEPTDGPRMGAETVQEELSHQVATHSEASWPQWPRWALPLLENEAFQGVYEIDHGVNPFFLNGDWDGDELLDLAVVVRARGTGERGLVVLRQASKQLETFGAGDGASPGGVDWRWFEAWKVESVLPAGVAVHPAGEAMILGSLQEVKGWLFWDGQQWQWVP